MTTTATTAPRAPQGTGVSGGEPDLWCTYAAVRTLAWLDRAGSVTDADGTAAYLTGRRNADGGYAWSRGMLSDAWATFYCTQGLRDLDRPVPGLDATSRWLDSTWSGDAYAMLPGQAPDVWATHFSARSAAELCGGRVPGPDRLLDWLSRLQCAEGGLSWSPEDARRGKADVRACYYGVMAWRAATGQTSGAAPPWDVRALVDWLRTRQAAGGGFHFAPAAQVPCLWATYRAVGALRALGETPRDPDACQDWIMGLRGPTGAFVRWEGYDVEDVWASFCAVGTLKALGAPLAPVADAVTARISELACAGGGYTYREPPVAADALSTAAAVLSADPGFPRPEGVRWLEGCQLPNEGGVMYMPGRGSEVRCTLWALSAGAFAEDPAARRRIAGWLAELQNADGGFGYWEGRGSDMVSTAAAVETAALLGGPDGLGLDLAGVLAFVDSCRVSPDSHDAHDSHDARLSGVPDGARGEPYAHGNVPGGEPGLRPALQAQRVRMLLGPGFAEPAEVSEAVRVLLARHRVRGGGYAGEGHRVPDLLSTYEAVLAADRAGLGLDTAHLRAFTDRVRDAGGTAWSPLAPGSGGPLADCLGTLLARRLTAGPGVLPALALS
ncbi:terpene cyclase/mutase family protein [Streptomyces sp. NEAU-H22]|uniref:prenyltransferase/squalene oxidase repeat-containing protein n=1 Tax=Streptomyces sp. NEAU-H22 TaxID=2994655 RepID=UPI0022565411|nr:prenyltransferase/squalene oxidase repeat-containing protein [Streptomyces sp. NEAU-H22]MCX3288113.1 terpene cyclase/mutase family protein [Streptomyces sp. NEAU-H22]